MIPKELDYEVINGNTKSFKESIIDPSKEETDIFMNEKKDENKNVLSLASDVKEDQIKFLDCCFIDAKIKERLTSYNRSRDFIFFFKRVHQYGHFTRKHEERNPNENVFYIDKITIIDTNGILVYTEGHHFICWYTYDDKYKSIDYKYWDGQFDHWSKTKYNQKQNFKFVPTGVIVKVKGKELPISILVA